jgi:D-3-phosphoglycerate dehydrogenase / 2-oxoglutarate reductase
MLRVAVTDYTFPDFTNYRAELAGCGAELVIPERQTLEGFLEIARDADAVIHEYLILTEAVLAELKRCRVISHHGKGVDKIDVAAATARGIVVANVLDAAIHEVVEHLLGLMISVARRFSTYQKAVQSGQWNVPIGQPLYRLHGKTLGLLGFGTLARQTALKVRSLGLEVIVYARKPAQADAERYGVRFVDLATLFQQSDILSVHIPHTQETTRLVSRDLIGTMKSTAILINISRGAIVDEEALAEALASGRIFGAGLDVLAVEPPRLDNPLLGLENVVITPHCAWYSEEGREDVERRTAREIARVLKGEWPSSFVNPEVKSNFNQRWKGVTA